MREVSKLLLVVLNVFLIGLSAFSIGQQKKGVWIFLLTISSLSLIVQIVLLVFKI